MKTKEELDALKEEVNNVNEKLRELTPEELEQVNGGVPYAMKAVLTAVGVAPDTSALPGKVAGVVVTTSEGRQGSEMRFGIR